MGRFKIFIIVIGLLILFNNQATDKEVNEEVIKAFFFSQITDTAWLPALLLLVLIAAFYKITQQQQQIKALKTQNLLVNQKATLVEDKTKEITLKNEEIAAQNEEMLQIQQELTEKHRYIEEKSYELEKINRRLVSNEKVMLKAVQKLREKENIIKKQNQDLEKEVNIRTQELSEKNRELIDYTHQLEQFAFVTGHNLRAPIARLLGLVSIMDLENFSNPENKIYIKNLEIVTKNLDAIIKDLNRVLEVKRDSKNSNEIIDIKEKTDKVHQFLKQIYSNIDFDIYTDFVGLKEIISVSIYWESILYNLLSNAIKYRRPDMPCEIWITAEIQGNDLLFVVKDNGIGIDLVQHGDKIFGLYKRFHQHIDGKGLGLHLVKLQVESLGGTIHIDSTPNEGTAFTIIIPSVILYEAHL